MIYALGFCAIEFKGLGFTVLSCLFRRSAACARQCRKRARVPRSEGFRDRWLGFNCFSRFIQVLGTCAGTMKGILNDEFSSRILSFVVLSSPGGARDS